MKKYGLIHKKALEEDPLVFDYDGVYDKMKADVICPIVQDRKERKSKYVERLLKIAEARKREYGIVKERKLAKERSKDEHLYGDKPKFVTSAYKKKLAEDEKWLEEDRLREEKYDVTKNDIVGYLKAMREFHSNLGKINVVLGAKVEGRVKSDTLGKEILPRINSTSNSGKTKVRDKAESSLHSESNNAAVDVKPEVIAKTSSHSESNIVAVDVKPEVHTFMQAYTMVEQPSSDRKKQDLHKRKDEYDLAAARERYFQRRRVK
ncbi:hypothetical protein IFM89_011269 [Coptis chinensis]|uniref:Nuclear speckle splicing regulatory protein 1 N-terminal domain-containing protein n=1 Tax=Coptis chinensis TaxID=261450 RepID=A0A835LIV1_9MAGN|nr:hypothetical protein IFM89_011269 [Coptis chinensis]